MAIQSYCSLKAWLLRHTRRPIFDVTFWIRLRDRSRRSARNRSAADAWCAKTEKECVLIVEVRFVRLFVFYCQQPPVYIPSLFWILLPRMILDQFWIVSFSRSTMYSCDMLNDTMQQCTTTICACC